MVTGITPAGTSGIRAGEPRSFSAFIHDRREAFSGAQTIIHQGWATAEEASLTNTPMTPFTEPAVCLNSFSRPVLV